MSYTETYGTALAYFSPTKQEKPFHFKDMAIFSTPDIYKGPVFPSHE